MVKTQDSKRDCIRPEEPLYQDGAGHMLWTDADLVRDRLEPGYLSKKIWAEFSSAIKEVKNRLWEDADVRFGT